MIEGVSLGRILSQIFCKIESRLGEAGERWDGVGISIQLLSIL